jgi:chromosome segregation ATPase
MKTIIYKLTLVATIIVTSIFTGCESSAQKVDEAKAEVKEAKQDLKTAQQEVDEEAAKKAKAEEWSIFKADAETKINNNEIRITELKSKMNVSGKTMSNIYENRIKALEEQNKDLKARIYTYETNQSDWETFKREFNRDMDALGKALKDFGNTN